MKIGIEAQRIFRAKKHGMDVVAIELIKNLQEIDHQNQYVIFSRSGVNDSIDPTSNFNIDTFSALTYADWEQVSLARRLRKIKPDLLHCTANTAPLVTQIPLVLTLHDIIYLEEMNFKGTAYQNIGNLYRRFLVPKIVKKAALILTVSEFEKENIVGRLKIPSEKVKVLYNGVGTQFNTQYPSSVIEEFRKKYRLPQKFVMFLGNTAPKKNTLNVIKAYSDFCSQNREAVPLVLLDYKKDAVAKVLNELKCSKFISKFIFPGYIPYRDIPLMYNAATLFLYPSLRESFGLPILEAMACGVPVITSNSSSMPEIASDAAELIDPLNYKELSHALTKLMSNDELRRTYIEKGLKRAKKFTWRTSAEQLLAFYESI